MVKSAGILFVSLYTPLFPFQVVQCVGTICMNSLNGRTTFHVRTAAASCHAFFQCALANATEALTVNRLSPIHTTALTVDVLWQDRSMIQFRPQLCRLLTQCMVVVLRCDVCVALLAIQSAVAYHLLHLFHRFSIGKNPRIICLYSSLVIGLGICLLTSSTNWAQCSIISSIVMSCRKWPSA